MAKMNALNAKPVRQPAPLKVTLLWSPQGVHGVAMTAVDVLKVMHGLASMRQAGAVAEPVWRWRSGSGGLVPRWPQTLSSLPTTPYRALPDLLLVPGWHAFNGPHLDQLVHQAADAVALIQRVHAAGACVLAVGNGVALLGLAGLLRDREAVAPWQFVQAVLRHSEGVRLQTDRPWTVSDRIWTCETPLWTTEMLLDALKTTRGAELAVAASHVLLHSPERQQVAAQIEQDVHARRVPPGVVARARRWLEAHVAEPYDLARLAQAVAASPRTLLRHFASSHQQSPLLYLQGLRMARARVLLETTYLPVDQLALACGYTDAGTFRRHFLRTSGELPATYRQHNRLRTSRARWLG
ncbi:hypothetical protein LBMAG30_25100 [Comamonadaceae bacterium]|nr:hypothetical protein LBMAG30_25100 [Comamonadaceae bacterium]